MTTTPSEPPPAAASPGAPLAGRVDAAFRATDTRLLPQVSTAPPLELRGPFYSGGALDETPRYFLRNVTAGVFGGDRLDIRIRAESGARVRIQPTSATRAHESLGEPAIVTTHIEVAAGAHLTYDAGTTILQQSADFEQRTDIVVHPVGTLHYLEVVALGRLASRERLAFRRFESTLTARTSDGVALYRERFELTPAVSPALLEAALGGASVIGTLLILGRTSPLDPALFQGDPAVLAGSTALPRGEGQIVRVLASRVEPVRCLLEAASEVSRTTAENVDALPPNRVQ